MTTIRNTDFDLERELRLAETRVLMLIELRAAAAIDRLYDLYTIPSGICHCGGAMLNHPVWDNHAPCEMRMDKSYESDDTL